MIIDVDLPQNDIVERPAIVRTADEMGVGLESKVNSFFLAKNIPNAVKEEENTEETLLVGIHRPYKYFFDPIYSPDGTKIIFTGKRFVFSGKDSLDILIANSDGSGVRTLVKDQCDGFWIDNEHICIHGFDEEDYIFYKVPISGGKWKKTKTKFLKYPKEDVLILSLYLFNDIDIVRMKRKPEKRLGIIGGKNVYELYVDGRISKLDTKGWRHFDFSPSGTELAYNKTERIPYNENDPDSDYIIRTNLYIQPIKPLGEFREIVQIGEPVIIESCNLLGFITQGKYQGNIACYSTGRILICDKKGERVSHYGLPEMYGCIDVHPDLGSVLHTPSLGGPIYILRLNQK